MAASDRFDIKYLRILRENAVELKLLPQFVDTDPFWGSEVVVRKWPRNKMEEDIFEHFSSIGSIYHLKLPLSTESTLNRGFFFLKFLSPTKAENCVQAFKDVSVEGQLIEVELSFEHRRILVQSAEFECKSETDIENALDISNIYPCTIGRLKTTSFLITFKTASQAHHAHAELSKNRNDFFKNSYLRWAPVSCTQHASEYPCDICSLKPDEESGQASSSTDNALTTAEIQKTYKYLYKSSFDYLEKKNEVRPTSEQVLKLVYEKYGADLSAFDDAESGNRDDLEVGKILLSYYLKLKKQQTIKKNLEKASSELLEASDQFSQISRNVLEIIDNLKNDEY